MRVMPELMSEQKLRESSTPAKGADFFSGTLITVNSLLAHFRGTTHEFSSLAYLGAVAITARTTLTPISAGPTVVAPTPPHYEFTRR